MGRQGEVQRIRRVRFARQGHERRLYRWARAAEPGEHGVSRRESHGRSSAGPSGREAYRYGCPARASRPDERSRIQGAPESRSLAPSRVARRARHAVACFDVMTSGVGPVAEPVNPKFQMRGVRKAFGGTIALDGVDLAVRSGEVCALVGQNGAGKSTLMSI